MVINPHFANLPRVSSPVSQTVNQGQQSQGINALANFGGLGQPRATPGMPSMADPGHSMPGQQPGAAIGYNPQPQQQLNTMQQRPQPGGLLPPTGLEQQPIQMPPQQPVFNIGAPDLGGFDISAGGNPDFYTQPDTQPGFGAAVMGDDMFAQPDRNPYDLNMNQGRDMGMDIGTAHSGLTQYNPAALAQAQSYAHAMPAGLTEQQQFDYLNPRGLDGRPLYHY
jgi:hypothetical protein